jgi:FlaA1/EpsC-like NDP-sugar epimerase
MHASKIEDLITFRWEIGKSTHLNIQSELPDYFNGKTVAITGGAGSIGSNVAKFLLRNNDADVWILDNDDSSLFIIQS